MKKRIFGGFCVVAVLATLLTVISSTTVYYKNLWQAVKDEISQETEFISSAIKSLDEDEIPVYIGDIGKKSKNRITLISEDGTVVYDNYADAKTMDNHLEREEIKSANETGYGETTRYSKTANVSTYYFAKKVNEDLVLRVSCTRANIFAMITDVFVFIGCALFLVIVVSVWVSKMLSMVIVKPLKQLNLDNPLDNDTYAELSHLLVKMDKQNKKIKNQTDALAMKNKEVAYITNNVNEAIIIFKENGEVLSVNNSARELFGCEENSFYLDFCRDIEYENTIKKALNGENVTSKLNYKNKTYRLNANAIPKDGEGFAVFLFVDDITSEENATQMRKEFSANVSHELKTPLTTIMGCAEIIENGVAKVEDVPHFAKQIYQESARLLNLIEDIIKLSKLDEKSFFDGLEDVDLEKVGKDVYEELKNKAEKAKVDFQIRTTSKKIKGYESLLHETIYNLCDNAITYNRENGTVELVVPSENQRPVVIVRDTGIGIEPQDQERIFERFYRVDKSHSKETGGTGLGLSIVKHAINLHKGEISIESTIGAGTTIKISF
ncbi:MAG: ATP-binding protein [Oscillospiraceae bacterium]